MPLVIPKLVSEGNFRLEGFSTVELMAARAAVREVRELSALAVRVTTPTTFASTKIIARGILLDWFGLNSVVMDAAYLQLRANLHKLDQAIRTGIITLVYRPDIIVKDAAGSPMMLGADPFTGANVFGYVHLQQGGSGYRVICGKPFITDRTPYYASTTIYHELTHKLLQTTDLGYGDVFCKGLALKGPATAMTNADTYAYFVIALAGVRARLMT